MSHSEEVLLEIQSVNFPPQLLPLEDIYVSEAMPSQPAQPFLSVVCLCECEQWQPSNGTE